ncbi:MAG TPA: class I SAM-dependent methyltransferase, partial [Oscillatoriaceae cyanobacterium]
IDYTPNGCAQAEAVLARAGVGGEVYCRDFFELPGELAEAFDWGVSFGVAEHFQDTASCLEAFSRYLKPGAGLITTIPNLSGALGWLQKRADRAVYDIHVPLDREQLRAAHERAGFRVESCDYFLSANWSVLNFESWRDRRLQALGTRVRSYASKVFWLADEAGVGVSPNRLTSPYIVCIARKL